MRRSNFMNARRFLISLTIILLIISSIAIVSAESDNIKTHEYNYANKAFFNISDDLTDEMEFKPLFLTVLKVELIIPILMKNLSVHYLLKVRTSQVILKPIKTIPHMRKLTAMQLLKDIRHIFSRIPTNMLCSLIWIILLLLLMRV